MKNIRLETQNPSIGYHSRVPRPPVAGDLNLRLQGTANHLAAGDRTVVAQLPIKGTKTLYTRLGDFFPWTCTGLLGHLMVAALLRGLRK